MRQSDKSLQSYDTLAKSFHWIMAFIIIYATIAGYVMLMMSGRPMVLGVLHTLNVSGATVAAVLLVFRWIWSFFRKTPELPNTIPKLHQDIAKFAHAVVYLVMFIVFVSGFLMLKHDIQFFWLFTIKQPISNVAVNEFFFIVHRISCAVLAVLIMLHVAAAMKHHFKLKNTVLKSMIFNKSEI